MILKECNTCKEKKPKEEYFRKLNSKDGYTTCCKRCIKQRYSPYMDLFFPGKKKERD